jgi:hypothetical protein
VNLFAHVGDVYRRVESIADDDENLPALRLAALVHEEPLDSLPGLLESAGLSDLSPVVLAVTSVFGRVWKVRTDAELGALVADHRDHLAAILLFEVAHEGRATTPMGRAAALAGLTPALHRWSERLLVGNGVDAPRRVGV